MELPTLLILFCVSIKLITGSIFRDIFWGDNRDIFFAARQDVHKEGAMKRVGRAAGSSWQAGEHVCSVR